MRFLLCACLALFHTAAFAQASSPHAKVLADQYRVESKQVQPETYGTSAESWYVISAREFLPFNSTVTFATVGYASTIYRTGGDLWFEAALHLPEGALLTEIQYQVCDLNPGNPMYASLWTLTATGNTFNYINMTPITSGGCGLFSHTYTPPVQIDNNGFTYGIELYVPVASANQRITTARVGYKLQVSPAPATATFTDVPTTHLFFQYVEALAAAGITSGCGGGNFCPDAAVTRGQLAVFLSKALGLHWAP